MSNFMEIIELGSFLYSSSYRDLLLPVTSSLVFESEMLLTIIHIHQYSPCKTQVLLVK